MNHDGENDRDMKKILIKSNGKERQAFLLARFNMVDKEVVSLKGMFGRVKNVLTDTERSYCLVFIPWKHQEKELALIPVRDVITLDKLVGDDIVVIEKFISPFTEENPYYAEYKILDFIGYKFIYDYKNFIADIRNQCPTKPLEMLYQHYLELLQEEIDEEQ